MRSIIITGQAKIAVTGTAVNLTAAALSSGLAVRADENNAAAITVGPSGVTNTVDGTGNGAILRPGATSTFIVSQTSVLYINGTAGDIVSYQGN